MKETNETLPVPGIYRHFKGKAYRVLAAGRHSETQEPLVTYQEIYGDCSVWTRPLKMWTPDHFTHIPKDKLNPLIDKISLILIKDGKILMARSHGKDVFYVPGGKREPGETDLECLTREINEELNARIIPESVQLFGRYYAQAHGKPDGTLIKMNCYYSNIKDEPMASREIEEIAWLTYADRGRVANAAKLVFDDLYWKGLIK